MMELRTTELRFSGMPPVLQRTAAVAPTPLRYVGMRVASTNPSVLVVEPTHMTTYLTDTTQTTISLTSAPPYDPDTEQEQLIRRYITRNPASGQAVLKRPWGYPVTAIVRNLLAAKGDRAVVRQSFPDLPEDAISAAERFFRLHRDDVLMELE